MVEKFKYKIKTEEQFIRDFGEYWYEKIACGWNHNMNDFFGKVLENDFDFNKVKHSKKQEKWYVRYKGFSISNDMITIISPTYKPKKIIRKI